MSKWSNVEIPKTEKNKTFSVFEGFESWFQNLRFQVKMHTKICIFLLSLQLLLFILSCSVTYSYPSYCLLKFYTANLFVESKFPNKKIKIRQPNQEEVIVTAWDISQASRIKLIVQNEETRLFTNFFKLFVATFLLYPFLLRFFYKKALSKNSKQYIRGSKLMTAFELNTIFEEENVDVDLPCGEINMPRANENRHTMVIGKQGAGKSNALGGIIQRLIERDEKILIYDKKGEYVSQFYNPETDLIFNPLDSRSLGWNLFNELDSYMDVDSIAASLVPPASGSETFWNDAARGVFSGVLLYLYKNNLRDNANLWKALTNEAKELSKKLKGTKGGEAGYRYITQNSDNSTVGESVLAVVMQYTKCFEYMEKNDGSFSISEWLKNGTGRIYVTNYEDIEETLRPILSLFIDLVGRKLLSMPDSKKRRIYFMLDEFGSLQRLTTIIRLLTLSRSKGGCVFLAVQDDGQSEKTYGPQLLRSIDNACTNRITFSLSGETAKREAQNNIGETEYMETVKSESLKADNDGGNITISQQKKSKLLFLGSDIENIRDLTAIVKLRNYSYVVSKWKYRDYEIIAEPFLQREDLLLENFMKDQKTQKKQYTPKKNTIYEKKAQAPSTVNDDFDYTDEKPYLF